MSTEELLMRRIRELESQVAMLEQDAKRYQWLREGKDNIMLYGRYYTREQADAAIDAALSKEKP